MANKYVTPRRLETFLENLKSIFALSSHKHTLSDLTNYTVDSVLSDSSINPVQNKVLNEEFDAISDGMGALEQAIDGKAEKNHSHNDVYYTETEIDTKLSEVNTSITNITNGNIVVKEAEHATSADKSTHSSTADSSVKATQDGSGNVITDTYEIKSDAQSKLEEAKSYTDTAIANLVNSAPETLDTLGELATAFNENKEVVDALDDAITNKADTEHTHDSSEILFESSTKEIKGNTVMEVLEMADLVISNMNSKFDKKADIEYVDAHIPTEEEVINLLVETGFISPATTSNGDIYTNIKGDIYSM